MLDILKFILGIPVYLVWMIILVVTAFLPKKMQDRFDEMVRTVWEEIARKEAERKK